MKVYLDDERETPPGWTRTYTVQETINLLKSGQVTHLSLDHDLGTPEDGNDVLIWLEEEVAIRNFDPPEILIHSANPAGKKEMEASLFSINRFVERNRAS